MKRRKQNQNISFQFFVAPPCTPRRFFKDKEIFGFACATRGSAPEARNGWHYHRIRAYDIAASYHARGACELSIAPRLLFKKGSRKGYNLTATNRNSNFRKKYGRHEVPSVLNSPQKILNLKGFATRSVAQKVRFDL